MLDVWEKAGTDEVLAAVERHSEDAREKIQVFFDMAPSADFTVELALRDWARRDRTVAARLRRIDERRMGFISALFGEFCSDEEDAEARAMLTYSLLIGSWFVVARGAGKRRKLQLAVDRLLT